MPNLKEHILALEKSLMTPELRWSADALESVLSPDFREFGRSGLASGYRDTIAHLTGEVTPLDVTIDDFELAMVSDTVALATYRSTLRLDGGDRLESLRSSIWRRDEDGEWRMVFHQGTPARTG